MTEKTTNYSMFKIRNDNRAGGVSFAYAENLAQRIKKNNLLDIRPIIVNENMEVLDGQHRLKAAEILGVPIYYNVISQRSETDLVDLNYCKNWVFQDYLNYYAKNGFPEYQKLVALQEKLGTSSRIFQILAKIQGGESRKRFNRGQYVHFSEERERDVLEKWPLIQWTGDAIREFNPKMKHLPSSGRFQMALMLLFDLPGFNRDQWKKKVVTHVKKFRPCPTLNEYIELLEEIYNYGRNQPISINEKTS